MYMVPNFHLCFKTEKWARITSTHSYSLCNTHCPKKLYRGGLLKIILDSILTYTGVKTKISRTSQVSYVDLRDDLQGVGD